MVIGNIYVVFLLHSIYHRTRRRALLGMVGATPYKLFWKGVSWVNKQLASSDFTLRKR